MVDFARQQLREHYKDLSRNPRKAGVEVGKDRYIFLRAKSLSYEFYCLVLDLFGSAKQVLNKEIKHLVYI